MLPCATMPSDEERSRRKTELRSLEDKAVAQAKRELDARLGQPTDWFYAAQYADALFRARRLGEALKAYRKALSLCPGECGTASIEEHCRRRIAQCRRRGSV